MKWTLAKIVTHLIFGNLFIIICLYLVFDSFSEGFSGISAFFAAIVLGISRYLSYVETREIDESKPKDNG